MTPPLCPHCHARHGAGSPWCAALQRIRRLAGRCVMPAAKRIGRAEKESEDDE